MPASVVGYSSNYGGPNAAITWAYPSGTQAGDVVILSFSLNGGINGFPSFSGTGWTALNALQSYNTNIPYNSGFAAWFKVVTASDISSPPTASFSTYNSSDYKAYQAVAYRGPAIGVHAYASNGASSYGGGTNYATLPPVTTTKTGLQLMAVGPDNASGKRPSGYVSDGYLDGQNSYPGIAAWRRTAVTTGTGNQGGEAYTNPGALGMTFAISTNVVPNAPTVGLADNQVLDRTVAQALPWTPSDPDGDAQVGYDVQVRVLGTSTWKSQALAPAAGATASYSFPANSMAGKVEAQVRTYDGSGPGAWSASRILDFRDPSVGTASTAASRVDPLAALAMHTALKAQDAVAALSANPSATLTSLGLLKAQGTYSGDNSSSARAIAVGFTPDLVFVSTPSGSYGGFMILHRSEANNQFTHAGRWSGSNASPDWGSYLSAGGFTIQTDSNGPTFNSTGVTYYWTAFKLS